jgi:lysophospholipase L1-like esterase
MENIRTFQAQSDQTAELWAGTWGTSPQLMAEGDMPPAPGLSHHTLRQIVRVSVGGQKLRLKLTNEYGLSPVTLNAVQLALAEAGTGGAIKTKTNKAVTFGGHASATIPAGASLISDSIEYDLPKLANVAITVAFGDTPDRITGHAGARTTSYFQSGNAVDAPSMTSAITIERWYFIHGIDVLADEEHAAVVALGDSITDGRGVITDTDRRWTDVLAERLQHYSATSKVGVLNAGIGGNAVLNGGLGPTATARFERDVIKQSGVRYLILAIGINDVGYSTLETADRLINRFQAFIQQAHKHNVKVYGATLTPFGGSGYYSVIHEEVRQRVNEWIRNSGEFDAVIDFERAVADPNDPLKLLSANDSGDHLHLSPEGYRTMADAIDLRLFRI